MSVSPSSDIWDRLGEAAPAKLVDHLRERTAGAHGRIAFRPDGIAKQLSLATEAVRQGLLAAVDLHILDAVTESIHVPCGTSLSESDLAAGICPHDDMPLDDDVEIEELFVRDEAPARDVPWVLCVHGMNTRGAWEEELAWRVAKVYRRSVPVYVYMYGRVELGALVRWRQRRLANSLAETVRTLAGEPQGSRLGPRPDVVCHSFGTWMIGHALLGNEDVKVGRIVLVASILRPDFPWGTLIERGQVEAVLSHRGGKDLPVRLAAYAIPDSGPSGYRGFDPDVPVVDRLEAAFSHSAFFDVNRLHDMFVGQWQPFLTSPSLAAGGGGSSAPTSWKPPSGLMRFLVRATLFLIVSTLAAAAALIVGRGAWSLCGALEPLW